MDTHVALQPGNAGEVGGTGTAAASFLVVLCHGVESTSNQLSPLAKAWRAQFPTASFLLPDAPQACRSRFWHRRGRQWFSLNQSRAMQITAAAEAAAWLNAQVDTELARCHLPPDAVVYCGFSQGAMVAMLAGVLRDVAPLGIVSIAGALLAPEAGFTARCRPPVLLVHGEGDEVVPAARSQKAALRLQAAGLDVQLQMLPRLGHLIVADAAPFAADFIARVSA